tara:strand:+ start:149 stop:295 length:147 start_codon:yes stop_codon:yes gene_type:complete
MYQLLIENRRIQYTSTNENVCVVQDPFAIEDLKQTQPSQIEINTVIAG